MDEEEENHVFDEEQPIVSDSDEEEVLHEVSGVRMRARNSVLARNLSSKWGKFVGIFPKRCREKFDSFWIVIVALVIFVAVITVSLVISRLFTVIDKGAVATDVPACTDMATRILQRRGSAVDAAITALLCVGLYHPESSGIGGGGFMMVRHPNGSVYALDFREMAPSNSTWDMYNSSKRLQKTGGLAVAVPGEVKGMKMAHDLFGKLPWSTLLDPVIDRAYYGFKVTKHLAKALQLVKDEPTLKANKHFNDTFRPGGNLAKEGDTLTNRMLTNALLAMRSGIDSFYTGDIAKSIVEEAQNNGGNLTMDDLAEYTAYLHGSGKENGVLALNVSNMTFYAPPLPSGGPVLLYILNTLNSYNFSSEDLTPSTHYPKGLVFHRMVEAFKFAFAARSKMGDPMCWQTGGCNMDLLKLQEEMINVTFGEVTRGLINDSTTYSDSAHYRAPFGEVEDSGTSHVSVLDPSGLAVSVTSTINSYFGAKLMTSKGFFLNNEMADFSRPNDDDMYGFPPNAANFPGPRKRPQSSMCPVIAKKVHGQQKFPELITGASGGLRIPTAVTQCVLGHLFFDLSLSDSIEHRRVHHQLEPDTVYIEETLPEDIVTFLQGRHHNITVCNSTSCDHSETNSYYAVVQGVSYGSSGIVAHADSRKQGQGEVVNVLE